MHARVPSSKPVQLSPGDRVSASADVVMYVLPSTEVGEQFLKFLGFLRPYLAG
jgi:hypothetical protein